jgi:polyphosphate kinase
MSSFLTPANFINRELSWLEFNRRVLEEAEDPSQPLLERVKFLGIFASNLDEFFEIRVAGIKQQIQSGDLHAGPDGLSPFEVFESIQKRCHEMVDRLYILWKKDIAPLLATEGIKIHRVDQLSMSQQKWAHEFFQKEVFPVLTPLAIDASHPFPQVLNKSHNLLIRGRKPKTPDEPLYAIVQVPRVVPRLIRLPASSKESEQWNYIYLSSLIKHHIQEVFPGILIEGVHAFRITRNSDLYIDDEEAENLLRAIEEELHRRNKGNAVRIEVEHDCPESFQQYLLETFRLGHADLYRAEGPITMGHLMPLYNNEAFARLKDRPFQPIHDPLLETQIDIFETMRRRDILLHHPYESFDDIVALIQHAVEDPKVLAIKMTLYRTSGDSPVIRALMDAARHGKQVTALVELKARFDEANNIEWARRMEDAGVHAVYGLVGLKTHCKMLLIVRKEEEGIRHYVHLGTGNYNPSTARAYTDLSLLTSRPAITTEVATLFNVLTGLTEYPGFQKLSVAPFDLHTKFKMLIHRERDHAKAGGEGRIIVKINSLVDEGIIEALYEASNAGVKIDLIVRGICCLRPQLKGVSENIRVISIVGRFLEHSRIFHFQNAGKPETYLGSADWMPRNLYRRIEVLFPVDDPELQAELSDVILPAFLKDCVKARELLPDGSYRRLSPSPQSEASQAQLFFRERTRSATRARLAATPQAARLTVGASPFATQNS